MLIWIVQVDHYREDPFILDCCLIESEAHNARYEYIFEEMIYFFAKNGGGRDNYGDLPDNWFRFMEYVFNEENDPIEFTVTNNIKDFIEKEKPHLHVWFDDMSIADLVDEFIKLTAPTDWADHLSKVDITQKELH